MANTKCASTNVVVSKSSPARWSYKIAVCNKVAKTVLTNCGFQHVCICIKPCERELRKSNSTNKGLIIVNVQMWPQLLSNYIDVGITLPPCAALLSHFADVKRALYACNN